MKKGFTLLELIFVIVIIGVLAVMALPKFKNLTGSSKISSEIATASTVQSAIDDVHSDWIVNDQNDFTWGNGMTQDDLNDNGYPKALGDCANGKPFSYILKNAALVNGKWTCEASGEDYIYRGPASQEESGVGENDDTKPDSNDCWVYSPDDGSFRFVEDCNL